MRRTEASLSIGASSDPTRIGQAIVRIRRSRARRGLIDAGMERLAMRAGRPSAFCRCEGSSGQQQGCSDRNPCRSCHDCNSSYPAQGRWYLSQIKSFRFFRGDERVAVAGCNAAAHSAVNRWFARNANIRVSAMPACDHGRASPPISRTGRAIESMLICANSVQTF